MRRDELHDDLLQEEHRQLRAFAEYFLKPDVERGLVLTAHLVVENLLTVMVSTRLVHPTAWLRDSNFQSKVKLARALGLIGHKEENICAVLNKARNALVHKLDPLPDATVKEIARLALGKVRKRPDPSDLNMILRFLVATISAAWLRVSFQKNLAKLRTERRERWLALLKKRLYDNLELLGEDDNSPAMLKTIKEVDAALIREIKTGKQENTESVIETRLKQIIEAGER